jgi:hypothetical protein
MMDCGVAGVTTTTKGLKVKAELDSGAYPCGIKVSKAEIEKLQLKHAKTLGDRNYIMTPTQRPKRSSSFRTSPELQEEGLGGRQRMGCSLFVWIPTVRPTSPTNGAG